jgi:hypothetical protein
MLDVITEAIAPKTLYTLATGKPLPDWTTTDEHTTYQSPSITTTSTQNAHREVQYPTERNFYA